MQSLLLFAEGSTPVPTTKPTTGMITTEGKFNRDKSYYVSRKPCLTIKIDGFSPMLSYL